MIFENDYSAFMRSIYLNDIQKAESIIAASDVKNNFISNAIEDFGEMRIKTFLNSFKSSGLKRSISSYIDL